MLQSEINVRDEKIKELRKKLTRMEINLSESQFDTELHQKRFDYKFSDHQVRFVLKYVEKKCQDMCVLILIKR